MMSILRVHQADSTLWTQTLISIWQVELEGILS
jgi:hypothetical protein